MRERGDGWRVHSTLKQRPPPSADATTTPERALLFSLVSRLSTSGAYAHPEHLARAWS